MIARTLIKLGTLGLVFGPSVISLATEVADPGAALSARSLGRSGATVATNLSHDSLLQNPASSAFQEKYAVTLGYLGAGDSLVASIVDTKSGPIGGGVYYMRRDLKDIPTNEALGDYARMEEHVGFSLMGRPSARVGIGTNFRHVYRRSYTNEVSNGRGWNFDVGARFQAQNNLFIGGVAQNLMADEKGLFPRRFCLGVDWAAQPILAFSAQIFKVDAGNLARGFEVPNAASDVGWSTGAEYSAGQGFAIRAGYMANPTWDQNLASLGGGWESKTFALDYAFQMSTKASRFQIHTLSLTGFF